MTLEEFESLTGIKQSTNSMTFKRETRIDHLQVYLISALADVANLNIDSLLKELFILERKYDVYKLRMKKEDSRDLTLFELSNKESRAISMQLKQNLRVIQLSKKALDKNDTDLFLKEIVTFYESIDRTIPSWITNVFDNENSFSEIVTGYLSGV